MPPAADFTYSLFNVPPTQRNPSPKTAGAARLVVPCKKIVSAVANSPLELKTTLSTAGLPVACS